MLRTSNRMRSTAGFSLDDAARIRHAIAGGAAGACPQCEFPLEATVGRDGEKEVWLVRCHGCWRSLVVRYGTGPR